MDEVMEVTADIPSLQLRKGNYLLLIRMQNWNPGSMILVKQKTGRVSLGLAKRNLQAEGASDEPDVFLDDGAGGVALVKQGDIEEIFLVAGVWFGEQVSPKESVSAPAPATAGPLDDTDAAGKRTD
jgi:hypothetical protein